MTPPPKNSPTHPQKIYHARTRAYTHACHTHIKGKEIKKEEGLAGDTPHVIYLSLWCHLSPTPLIILPLWALA